METKKTYPPSSKEKKKRKKTKSKKNSIKKKQSQKKNEIEKILKEEKGKKETTKDSEFKLTTKNLLIEKTEKELTLEEKVENLSDIEKKEIINNILTEQEYEKKNILLMKNIIENEENKDNKKKGKKSTKNISIDVEENLILQKDESIIENSILEVKNRKFNKPYNIEDTVLYDGYVFKKDSHQTNNYPLIINYRCKNYRKNQRIRESQFCNAFLKKRKVTIIFI